MAESREKDLFRQIFERNRLVYNFGNIVSSDAKHMDQSGMMPDLTVTEVHLLVDIKENPGITVSEIGRMNKKTRGAISQMVAKLEKKGLIQKKVSVTHGKMIELMLTPLGLEVATEHEKYDVMKTTRALGVLLETCTPEEVDAFFKVLGYYTNIWQNSSGNE